MKRSGVPATRSTMSGRSTRSALSTSIRRRPLRRVLREHRLDQRRLAGAARAGQQHVVGGQPRDELPRVARRSRASASSIATRSSRRIACGCAHRLQVAAAAALAPARGGDACPVRIGQRRRQHRLDAREHALGARDQVREINCPWRASPWRGSGAVVGVDRSRSRATDRRSRRWPRPRRGRGRRAR